MKDFFSLTLQDKVCQGQHHNMATSPTQRGASKREIGWTNARQRIHTVLKALVGLNLICPVFKYPIIFGNMVEVPTQRGASKREIGWMSARLRIRNAQEGIRCSSARKCIWASPPSFSDPLSAPSLPHRTSKVTLSVARSVFVSVGGWKRTWSVRMTG